jgi:integrase
MLPNWEEFRVYLYIRRKLDQSNDRSYFYCFKLISEYFKDKELNLNNIDLFFFTQQSRNISNATLNQYLKMLKHICRCLNLDILRDYTYFKKIQPTYRILTDIEVKKLEKCYIERGYNKDSEVINFKYSTLIHLLARTGLRINEALSLNWNENDIQPDRIIIRAVNNKTDKSRQIPITVESYGLLKKLTKFKHGFIFGDQRGKMDAITIRKELKLRGKFLRMKDYENLSPHQFRHYFVTSLLRQNVSINLVARLAGHSVDVCDRTYSHYVIQDMKTAIEMHPLNSNGVSFETIKEKIKDLANQVSLTNHHLHLSEKDFTIILEVQDGR